MLEMPTFSPPAWISCPLSLDATSRSLPPSQPAQSRRIPPTDPSASHKRSMGSNCVQTEPFIIRPWTHLLLSENPLIYNIRSCSISFSRPPSILESLLGCKEIPHKIMMVPHTVTSLSYIGMYPVDRRFGSRVRELPRIESLHSRVIRQNEFSPEERKKFGSTHGPHAHKLVVLWDCLLATEQRQ